MVRVISLGGDVRAFQAFAATPEAARLTALVHWLLPTRTATDNDIVNRPGGDAS